MTKELVLIGIGQTIRGDDSAGLAAVQAWQNSYPDSARLLHVRVELAELPGIHLLSLLAGAETAILVDAVRSGAVPGTVHILSEAELASFLSSSGSTHGLGVAETLAIGRQLTPDQLPRRIILVGIEAGNLGMGEPLSPLVSAALPQAVKEIDVLVRQANG